MSGVRTYMSRHVRVLVKDGKERVRANQHGSPSFMLLKKYFIQFPSLTPII
jgi:hypothetical protein